ncbi:MAG: Endoribonuclease, partial [Acidobacteriaceae bacterium]|nr:Endoribonuclease [Acidobacteriaceae bacterium]
HVVLFASNIFGRGFNSRRLHHFSTLLAVVLIGSLTASAQTTKRIPKDGKMDVTGARARYSQFFGTKDQPNKPACTTVQVVLPAGARRSASKVVDRVFSPQDASA